MKITKREVYNVKNKEVRIETYIDGEFYTDKVININIENNRNLPNQ